MTASFVVPCRNAAATVRRTIDSVLASTCGDLEVIAVDDGSTDSTPEALAGAAARDGRVRVFRTGPRGVSAARNRGLDEARGEYVFFADADDAVEPQLVAKAVARLEKTGADYALFAYHERREGGDWEPRELKDDYEYDGEGIRTRYLPRIYGYSFDDVRAWYAGRPLGAEREMAGVWRAAYRRSVIEENRVRFDETIGLFEDAVFNTEYLLRASRMTSLHERLYRYNASPRGAMLAKLAGPEFFANKVRLLRARERLDALAERNGPGISALHDGTNVLSLLEMLRAVSRLHPGWRAEGLRACREFLADPNVRRSLAGFPVSPRRPVLAAAVVLLRRFFPA